MGTQTGSTGIVTVDPIEQDRDALRASLQVSPPETVAEAVARLERLADLDVYARRAAGDGVDARFDALLRIHESMGRLRDDADTPEGLVAAAPRRACEALGFSRAMISRVHGSMWVPQKLHIAEGVDVEGGAAFRNYIEQVEIPLEHMLLEAELVRRRIPAIVEDPAGDARTYKDIVGVARSPSYVAAPILSTRRVIGFFHADRFDQGREVTVEDRDALWIFAEHFALLYERTVLLVRLEEQRTRLQEALAAAAERIDAMCTSDIELVRTEPIQEPPPRQRSGAAPGRRIDGLLTAREQEVLELMAVGRTNTAIAQMLVISEGTVKSHVKHILRKMRVSNRAEAVSRYLRLVQRERRAGL